MKMTFPERDAPLQQREKSMKKLNLTRVIIASLVIGIIGAAIGGFFNMFLAPSEDSLYIVASGFLLGFSLCFLGSMWFLSMMRNRGKEAIYLVGALFGAGAGALSAFISIIFLYLTAHLGWLLDYNPELLASDQLALVCIFFGIPGAFIGFIVAVIITYFPGKILLKYVNRQPPKQTKSDSAPTEKK